MKRIHRQASATTLGLALLALLTPGGARADFVDAEVGARGLAMGGAFVAVEGDPASLYWNSAAILSESRLQVSGMRTRLFDGVEGLTEDFVGLTARMTDHVGIGAGWLRTGLEDVYHEDLITGAVAWNPGGGRLVVGASVLLYGIDAPGYEALGDPNYLGRQWEPSASLGALYRWSEKLTLGASVENLLEPEMSLVGSTEDVDVIGGRRRLGLAYVIQEVVRVTGEVRHHDFPDYYDSNWTLHAGAESWFSGVLAMRVGIDDGALAAGLGLVVDRVRLDGGLVTNERLGNTFRAAVTIGYGGGER